jgi:hypothetical protein
MHHFRGKLYKGEQVRLDPANVYIDYHALQASAGQEWDGYLVIESEKDLDPGGTYSLRLVDGRSGTLRITDIAMDEAEKVRANFVGEGALG